MQVPRFLFIPFEPISRILRRPFRCFPLLDVCASGPRMSRSLYARRARDLARRNASLEQGGLEGLHADPVDGLAQALLGLGVVLEPLDGPMDQGDDLFLLHSA